MSDPYLDKAFQALQSKFKDRATFNGFVSSIDPEERRKKFVFAAATYLFLVKRGDWHVAVDGVDEIITYFTQSYKLVGMFAVIESLSDKEYRDFYQWLSIEAAYPICDKKKMDVYFDQYNEDHGAIRRCRRFFEKLPLPQQERLCKAVKVNGEPLESIRKFAHFLYDFRSKFVHQAKFALHVGTSVPVISGAGTDNSVATMLMPETIEDLFEEGLIAWFSPSS